MAGNNIKGLTIEIGGDTTKLGKALQNVENKSRSLSTELGQINRLLKMDPGNADLLAQKQSILAEAVAATAKKLETLKEAEKQVQKQFERGEVSEEQLRALQREIIATENKMKGYQKAAKETAEAVEKLGKSGKDVSLSKTVSQQTDRLKELKAQYVDVVASQGKHSAEAKKLEKEIKSLSGELRENKDKLSDAEKAADKAAGELDDYGKSADKAEKSSGGLGKTLASAAKAGLAAVAAAASAAVAGLVASAEATREYRTEMGKLDTAFTQNGFTTEQAHSAYSDLVGVLGETDQSVEAANHLAKLTDNEKDLATWTGDILPGVFATFGDSLPIEGLTEAANETAKVGQVTGPLADALNWAGVSEDEFNESLAKCSTEQERQALITETLSGLYGEASEAYKKTNAEVIRANQANDAWMQSMAGVGAAVEPIITDVKMMGASLLSDAVPGVQRLADAFRGLMNGEDGAAADFGAAFSGLVTGLIEKITAALPAVAEVGLSIITTLATSLVQQIPQLLTTGGQIIDQLVTGLVNGIPKLMQKAGDMLTSFADGFAQYFPLIVQRGAELLSNLGKGIAENLPGLVDKALDALMSFATTLYDNAPTIINAGFELLSNLVNGIMNSLPTLLSKGPEIISKFANIINDNFPTILKKGVELIGQIVMGIIQAIPTLVANIPKIITAIVDVWEAFNWLNLGKKAIDLLKNGIASMWGAIKNAGQSIMNAAADGLSALPGKLLSLGKSAMSNLGTAIRNGVGTVKSGATAVFNGVVNTVKSLPSKMLSIGKDLVKGLWNGISDMTGWVIGKIQSFGDSVLSGIKSFFGIASPSRVFRDEVGAMLAEGMAKGIEENADAPLDAMSDLSDDLIKEASGLSLPTVGVSSAFNGLAMERGLQQTAAAQFASSSHTSLADKLDRILAAIERGQVIAIDGKQLIGATAAGYDSTLGQRRALVARGAL